MINLILDTFFPHRCVGCGKLGQPICQSCFPIPYFAYEDIVGVGPVLSLYRYSGVAKQAVHAIKFLHYPAPAQAMVKALGLQSLYPIVPLASGKRAIRDRGYLQTEVLASVLSCTVRCLLKKEGERRQVGANRRDRLSFPPKFQLLKGSSTEFCPHPKLLLFDDVLTTGASLQSASQTLTSNGYVVMGAIVLARDE